MKEDSQYTKGYKEAIKDIQLEVYKAIYFCTNSEGKISAKHLRKEISVEVFPNLEEPVFKEKD